MKNISRNFYTCTCRILNRGPISCCNFSICISFQQKAYYFIIAIDSIVSSLDKVRPQVTSDMSDDALLMPLPSDPSSPCRARIVRDFSLRAIGIMIIIGRSVLSNHINKFMIIIARFVLSNHINN